MAPYKLEDNIREKLEGREITPSTEAWKKLEERLGAQQPNKKSFTHYYAAAGFIGLIVLASLLFGKIGDKEEVRIVKETQELHQNGGNREVVPTPIMSNEVVSKKEDKGKSDENNNRDILKPNPQKKGAVDKKLDRDKILAQSPKTEEKSGTTEIEEPRGEDAFLKEKIDEVVASVKALEQSQDEISAAEVESLLTNAQREIQTRKLVTRSRVDATALLQDVEWELEKSFRDKVFDALGDGFRKIRTAVIERND